MTATLLPDHVWVSDTAGEFDHAIDGREVADAWMNSGAKCMSLCKREVTKVGVRMHAGRECPSCRRYVAARESLPSVEDRLQRRPGFVSRLMARTRETRHAANE